MVQICVLCLSGERDELIFGTVHVEGNMMVHRNCLVSKSIRVGFRVQETPSQADLLTPLVLPSSCSTSARISSSVAKRN